jgi:recombination protein RecR
MDSQAGPISRLIAELSRLPGIGQRTAQRLAFHILRAEDDEAIALADAIREVKERIRPCSRCFNLAEEELCTICADTRRDGSLICVVEDPSDVVALERTNEYRGLYHVLGGALSPLDGIGPDDLRIAELEARVRNGGVREVILATNPTVEGEATAHFLANVVARAGLGASRIAHGVPVGGELEYVDGGTLAHALAGRQRIG